MRIHFTSSIFCSTLFSVLFFQTVGGQSLGSQPSSFQVSAPTKIPTAKPQVRGDNLLFMENKGQVLDQHGHPNPEILFMGICPGFKVAVSANQISYQFEATVLDETPGEGAEIAGPDPDHDFPEKFTIKTHRLDMKLVGANPQPVVTRGEMQPFFENYYNIPAAPDGITEVRSFSRITLENVYPGIDWVIYSRGNGLKYDFIVHPGADPTRIRLRYDGQGDMYLNEEGALVVKTSLGELREEAPVSYSEKAPVDSRFNLKNGEITFSVGHYDPSQTLTIDPTLAWGTYYGGTSQEIGWCLALDSTGNVYLTGSTGSSTAIASGGHQNTWGGSADAFLVKFNSAGVRQWATYYGGSLTDYSYSTTVDGSGNVYAAGWTTSSSGIGFGGHQNTFTSANDAFLVKFNASGIRQWGTYYGGSGSDHGYSVSTDATGNVFLAGQTTSTSGIASGGHQNTYGGSQDGFLAKFNSSGVRQWGTYYGGSLLDVAYSSIADSSGNVYLTGTTKSSTGIASGGHQNTHGGGFDAFLVKFNTGGVRQWGTYYGNAEADWGFYTNRDNAGNLYIVGKTQSTATIASAGFQDTLAGGYDAYLVQFSFAGIRQWGTYYGGPADDLAYSVASDAQGNVYLAGSTKSLSGIASNGHQNALGGTEDGMLVKFNSSGLRDWGTYYGGTSITTGWSVGVDASANVFFSGETYSPTSIALGGHQDTLSGGLDAFLVKFQQCLPSSQTLSASACDSYTLNGQTYIASGTYTQTLTNVSGCDSIITLNLSLGQSSSQTLSQNACDSYTLNGQTYTASGTYTQTLTNVSGCDSIITLNLSLGQSSSQTLSQNACDSYTLNGQTYTASGTYTQTLTNAEGCDSILTLNLSISQSSSQTLSQSACDSYTLNGQTYTASGTYTQTLTNAEGCDSILTLNLVINASPGVSISPVAGPLCSNAAAVNLTGTPLGGTFSGTAVQGTTFNPGTAGPGTHSVFYTYTDGNNCTGMDSISVEVVICTAIDHPWEPEIILFPNPNHGFFSLEGIISGTRVEVWNVFGQLIYETTASETSLDVVLNAAGSGTYFLKLTYEQDQVWKKIIVR